MRTKPLLAAITEANDKLKSTAPLEGKVEKETSASLGVEAKDENDSVTASESHTANTLTVVHGKYSWVRPIARKARHLTMLCLSFALGILSICCAFISATFTWLADRLLDLCTWVCDRLDSLDK